MFTVAVIGPDGAGKSSVTQELLHSLPLKTRYLYMGVNLERSHLMLPTTWIAMQLKKLRGKRPDMAGPHNPLLTGKPSGSLLKRTWKSFKLTARISNLMAEEWFRQAVVWYYTRRGNVVLFDRHVFTDYYAYDIQGGRELPLINRIHGYMLRNLYPRPDVVICLDAPAEVLYARKHEASPELLEIRRQEYLKLRCEFSAFYVVDASQSMDQVVQQASDIIMQYHYSQAAIALHSNT